MEAGFGADAALTVSSPLSLCARTLPSGRRHDAAPPLSEARQNEQDTRSTPLTSSFVGSPLPPHPLRLDVHEHRAVQHPSAWGCGHNGRFTMVKARDMSLQGALYALTCPTQSPVASRPSDAAVREARAALRQLCPAAKLGRTRYTSHGASGSRLNDGQGESMIFM